GRAMDMRSGGRTAQPRVIDGPGQHLCGRVEACRCRAFARAGDPRRGRERRLELHLLCLCQPYAEQQHEEPGTKQEASTHILSPPKLLRGRVMPECSIGKSKLQPIDNPKIYHNG